MAPPNADHNLGLEGRTKRQEFTDGTGGPRKHTTWYSGFVRAMKIVLPAIALLLIVLIVAWPHLNVTDARFRIGFADMTVRVAEDPAMLNPRYVGSDKDNQPYSITADIARRLAESAENIELEAPKADILLKDNTWLVLSSNRGVYKREDEALDLLGSVILYHDSGYEFLTERAKIDLEKSAAEGQDPIRGQGPFGTIEAEGFRLVDRGKTIFFTGKSKLKVYPGAKKVN